MDNLQCSEYRFRPMSDQFSSRIISSNGRPALKALMVPGSLNFGDVIVGTESAKQVVTLLNEGYLPLQISAIRWVGDFHVTTDAPANGELPVNGYCSFTVTYRPTSDGNSSGALYVDTLNTEGNTFITLQGRGVDSISGPGGGGSSFIPWVYNGGSANGGELTLTVTENTVSVPELFLNGLHQEVGLGFTFDPDTAVITLADQLEEGDEVIAHLSGVPANPDNPNIDNWHVVNWLYNEGSAIGGEQVLVIPYTFQTVVAVFKNGLRYVANLLNKSFSFSTSTQSITLTEALVPGDRVVVQIGGEFSIIEMSDRTLYEVARSANVPDSAVILSNDQITTLNGKTVIYDVVAKKIWAIPSGIPSGATVGSVSGSTLTYSPGAVAVTLVELADDSLLLVKQPFTGAVAETQQDINKRSVGIYSFGVTANGSATGGTDDTAKLQAALDWCASTNQTLDLQGAKLFIAGTLTYQFKKHSIIGNNATIFVSDTNTNVWNLVGSTAPGTALADSSAYTFGGFSMYPGVVAVVRTTRTGFEVGSSTLDCGGLASDNVSLSGFNIGLTFGNNSYIHNFVKWKFTRCNKNVYYPSGLANSGENINFSHCVFANSDTNIDAGGDCVINVRDSSFDYSPEKIYAHAGGIVKANNCWFEGNDDTSVWIHTLNQLSTVILDKCTFIVAGARTKYLFDGATPQGGVILISPMITTTGNPAYSNPTWGVNNVIVAGTPIYRRPDVSNDTIPFSAGMSSTVTPNFNLTFTDSMRSDFSLRPASSGTTTRNETTSAAAGVTYNAANGYLTMQPPTGNVARITRTMLAAPGATVTASAYVKSTFSNATDQLDLNLYFKNAAGVTIALYNKRFNSALFNATPARANVLRGVGAPQGTAFIMFEITTTNAAIDGNSVHQISNFNIEAGNGVINIPYDTTQSPATGFTPYIFGATSAGTGTYTVQQGGYTLVGNLVFVNMLITWTGHTGTGQMKIGALPYLTDFPAGEIMNMMSTGITTTGALLGVMDPYANSMIVNQQGATGTLSSLQMTAAGSLQVTGVYRRC